MTLIEAERRTRHESHASINRASKEIVGIGAVGEAQPHEQSSVHRSDHDALREAVGQGVDQGMCSLAIQAAEKCEMLGEPSGVAQQIEGHALGQRRGVQIGGLFQAHAGIDEPRRTDHPADPQSGREHLRHRADANQRRRDDPRQGMSFEPQLAVGVVVDDERACPRGDLGELAPPRRAEGDSGRVVEVGHDVDDLWPQPAVDHVTQRTRVESVTVARYRIDRRADGSQHLRGTEVRGGLDNCFVAIVDHRAGDEIECLLRTVRYQDFVEGHAEALRDELAEVVQALGWSVLKRANAECVGERRSDTFDGQRFGRR